MQFLWEGVIPIAALIYSFIAILISQVVFIGASASTYGSSDEIGLRFVVWKFRIICSHAETLLWNS